LYDKRTWDIQPPLEVVRWADVISEQEAEVAPDTVEEEITRLYILMRFTKEILIGWGATIYLNGSSTSKFKT
jgi:hypothetical protein